MDELKMSKQHCLILEDFQSGIIEGKNAGIPVFFIKNLVMLYLKRLKEFMHKKKDLLI